MKFREWLLVESFEINNNYKLLTKDKYSKYWAKILDIDKEDLNQFYSNMKNLKCYLIKNEGREYFVYSVVTNNIYEVHFIDMDNIQEDKEVDNLGKTKNSLNVFSSIVSIVLSEINNYNKILIGSPDNKGDLYIKIIQKILKKYNIDKKVSKIILKNKTEYLLESYSDSICDEFQ